MQPISFYDDPQQEGRGPQDVRLKQLGLYVYEDGRRIAVGFDITPFRERPSIEVTATNERGEQAGSLTIIEAMSPNFSLTMHLRDSDPTVRYEIRAVLYYRQDDEERMEVDSKETVLDLNEAGEHVVK